MWKIVNYFQNILKSSITFRNILTVGLFGTTKKTKISVYEAIIQPVLAYGLEVWVTDKKIHKDFSGPK